jgi:hypothetical protein
LELRLDLCLDVLTLRLLLNFLLLFLLFPFLVLLRLLLSLLLSNSLSFNDIRVIFVELYHRTHLRFLCLLLGHDLFLSAVLHLLEVLRKLHIRKFLQVILVLSEVGYALPDIRAGVDNDDIPVDTSQSRLVVKKLGHELELKDHLAATVFAGRHIVKQELVRCPEWLNAALLL